MYKSIMNHCTGFLWILDPIKRYTCTCISSYKFSFLFYLGFGPHPIVLEVHSKVTLETIYIRDWTRSAVFKTRALQLYHTSSPSQGIFFWGGGVFGQHPTMLKGYSGLCAQELLLTMLRGPYGSPGNKLRSVKCKAMSLPVVLLLGIE